MKRGAAQRRHKPATKTVHRAALKPPVRKTEPMAKNPVRSTPKDEVPIADDPEAVRFKSTLEQVAADLAAGQLVTAQHRIAAALIHGNEPEAVPVEGE